MIIVPVKGDTIETKEGVTFRVMSYNNYREKGPAVHVEHTPQVPSDAVYFFDVNKINGTTVEYITGSKVFKSVGSVRRKWQLPQINDTVTFKGPTGPLELPVVGLKLHKRGDLAKGLLVVCEDKESDQKFYVRLDQILDLKRDIGNDLFSRDSFLTYYKDYRGNR